MDRAVNKAKQEQETNKFCLCERTQENKELLLWLWMTDISKFGLTGEVTMWMVK